MDNKKQQRSEELDQLVFKNNDRLLGKVKEIREGKILWEGGAFRESVRFNLINVKKLEIADKEGRKKEGTTTYVQLTNGMFFQERLGRLEKRT